MTDELIHGTCIVWVTEAHKVRGRLRYSGLVWAEFRKGLKVHFMAIGTRSNWENEYRRGGKHRTEFKQLWESK